MRSGGALAAGLLLSAAGCGYGGPAAQPADAKAGIPLGAEAIAVSLPFDAYTTAFADVTRAHRAADILIEKCMRSRGLGWTRIPDLPVQEAAARRRYGVIEETVAGRFGYHPAAGVGEAEFTRALRSRDAALSPAQRTTAYGRDGSGGCSKQAWTRLPRNDPGNKVFVWTLGARTLESAWAHTDVRRSVRRWRHCMRDSGFSFRHPKEAGAPARWGGLAGAPTRREIRTAVADTRCKKAAGLVPALVRVETELQRSSLKKHRARFARVKAGNLRWRSAIDGIITAG